MPVDSIRSYDGPRLPVFAICMKSARDRVRPLVHAVLGQELPDPFATMGGAERYRVGSNIVHLHTSTGALWIADDALWRLPAISEAGLQALHRELPGGGATRWLLELASRLCAPTMAGVTVNAEPSWSDGTRLVVWTRDTDTRETYVLDRTDSVVLTLTAPQFGLDAVPISGPGCALVHRAGVNGERLGLSGGVPAIRGVVGEFPLIPRPAADAALLKDLDHDDVVISHVTLAYRMVDGGTRRYLCPFWVYETVPRSGDRRRPASVHPVLAVDADLKSDALATQPITRPRPAGELLDWTPDPTRSRLLLSWLGEQAASLPLSYTTRLEVVRLLEQAGWICRDFGDLDAAESDWSGANSHVNQADLGCYIGHAAGYGFQMCPPHDAWLSDHECRFGGRLKWVIADACGPLQDQVAQTGASAFANWAQAFKGLRSLLGFATSQVQNTNQLARALEYALEGQPLAKAWFQAACEHQGVECTPRRAAWVAGMFGVHGKTTTIEDTLIAASLTPVIESDPAMLVGVWVPVG